VAWLVWPFLCIWAWAFFTVLYFNRVIVPAALSQWSQDNGQQIMQQKLTLFFRGPFAWNTGGFQVVYRLTLRDRDWHTRRAWIRLGRGWWPSRSVETCPIEVHWD
jgi:hypothetical protein